MTQPIRLVVSGPGALEFPSRKVVMDGDIMAPPDSKWAKKRRRLSVEPGEYALPLLPGSKLIVDDENNWGVNRTHSLLRSIYALPDLVRDVVKDKLKIRIGYRPTITGVSGGFSRERQEIHIPRHMSLVDNTPLAVSETVDHMVEAGQIALQDRETGRVISKDEAKAQMKKLFTMMAEAHPLTILESYPYVAHDPIKRVSPARTFPSLLGYQFRFLMRDALPTAELMDVNDLYLQGRRRFLADLGKQYSFPKGMFDQAMNDFDQDCQGPRPPGPNETIGRFRDAIVPKMDPTMAPHLKQNLLQRLYEGTQIEVIATLLGRIFRQHHRENDPGLFTQLGHDDRKWVVKPFVALSRFLRHEVLEDEGVMKQIAQQKPST